LFAYIEPQKREIITSISVGCFLLYALGHDERSEENESWLELPQLDNSYVKLPLIYDEHGQRLKEAAVLVDKELECRKPTFAPELRSGP
jgi:hypothetical protein